MKHFNRLLVVVALGLAAGCANYATFQDADTIPKGDSQWTVAATGARYEIDDGESTASLTVPALYSSYRRGLTSRLEAHAAVWLPLGSSVGAKYQLVGQRGKEGPSISLGLDVGYLQLTSHDENDMEVKTTIVDTYVPVYLGYRFSRGFAGYASPKYILRYGTGGDASEMDHLFGGTLGAAVGKRVGVLLEGTVLYDVLLEAPIVQGGLGLTW